MIAIMFGGRLRQSQKNPEQLIDILSGKVVVIPKLLFNKNVKFHLAWLFFVVWWVFFQGFPIFNISCKWLYGLTFFSSFLRFHFGGVLGGRKKFLWHFFLGGGGYLGWKKCSRSAYLKLPDIVHSNWIDQCDGDRQVDGVLLPKQPCCPWSRGK